MFCVPGEPSLALAEEGDDRPTAVCGADGWLVLGVYAVVEAGLKGTPRHGVDGRLML